MALDPVYLRAAAAGDPVAYAGLAGALLKDSGEHYDAGYRTVANDLLAQAEAFAVLGTQNGTDANRAMLGAVWFARAELIDLAGDPIRAMHFRDLAADLFAELNASNDIDALSTMALTYTAFLAEHEDADMADKLNTIIERLPAEAAVALREYERSWPDAEFAPVADVISGEK